MGKTLLLGRAGRRDWRVCLAGSARPDIKSVANSLLDLCLEFRPAGVLECRQRSSHILHATHQMSGGAGSTDISPLLDNLKFSPRKRLKQYRVIFSIYGL